MFLMNTTLSFTNLHSELRKSTTKLLKSSRKLKGQKSFKLLKIPEHFFQQNLKSLTK